MNIQINEILAGFKMTELGRLPDDWAIVRLGDYCDVFSGYAFKSQDFCDSGILVVKIGNLQNGTIEIDSRTSFFPNDKITDQIRKYTLKKGDILIALTGATTGKTALVPEHLDGSLLNQRVGKFLVTNDNLFNPFARFYFETDGFQEKIKVSILQSAQGNVSPKQVGNINILLPSLPEQKAIARVLSTIQKAIETQDKIISAARELKKSLMRHLFTYGPVPVAEAEKVTLKETEIGSVPERWEGSYIGKRCKILTGGTPRTEIGEYYYPPEIPWIKSGEVNKGAISSVNTYISKKGLQNSNATILPKYSVVIALAGRGKTRGTTAVLNTECACNQSIACMVPNDQNNYYYLHYYLTHLYDYIRSITGDKDRSGLNLQLIAKIPLFYPSLEEQKEIARMLSSMDKKIETEENRKSTLQALFKTMLHQLMTGKVRVKDLEATVA